ncbi:GD10126 [Drosophila simulans]|uniref:GD10126 n=1 Tax=Drosophila simulans TaxID=7240 RepID=B4NV57_DROSI|nr:GD10126 [Drosophila simulans]
MDENSCVPKLLKGGQARCEFLRNNEARVELVKDGMMFLSNFNGTLEAGPNTHNLNGTYIVQFANETISVAGRTYTSYSSSHFMAMPAILTTVTATGYAPSLHYVNDFNMENLRMSEKVSFSFLLEALVVLIVGALLYIIWRKLTSTKGIPVVANCASDPETLGAGGAPKAQ